jgi:hypothetical protein
MVIRKDGILRNGHSWMVQIPVTSVTVTGGQDGHKMNIKASEMFFHIETGRSRTFSYIRSFIIFHVEI